MDHGSGGILSKKLDWAYMDLNADFKKALNLMENTRSNLFITGNAGTGKSTLLEYFRSVTYKNVAVLAPTGVAALNVKGQTIHSFFHFKPDITPGSVKTLSEFNSKIYKALDMIIIDEISMVRSDLLDCVDSFMRLNGKNPDLPFGGVQMVFIGDLYQLPPVVTSEERGLFRGPYESQYFFDSRAFAKLPFQLVKLQKHYRQKDSAFIEMLNSIRNNTATDETIGKFNTRVDPSFSPKGPGVYVTLTTTNRQADEINARRLSQITAMEYAYHGVTDGDFAKASAPADDTLVVKEGAQVMMLNNDAEKRWVNGSMGRVVSIERSAGENDSIVVELTDGSTVRVAPYTWELFKFAYDSTEKKIVSKTAGSFTQYPMMLAWAITIHKSQGKTFDKVVVDVGSGTFAHGQLYVALSRCTTLEGIVLSTPIEKRHIIMDRRVVDFLRKIEPV